MNGLRLRGRQKRKAFIQFRNGVVTAMQGGYEFCAGLLNIRAGDARISSCGLAERQIGINTNVALTRKQLDHVGRAFGVHAMQLTECSDIRTDLGIANPDALSGRVQCRSDFAECFSPMF